MHKPLALVRLRAPLDLWIHVASKSHYKACN